MKSLTERIKQRWATTDKGIYTEHTVTVSRATEIGEGVTCTLLANGMGAFILEYGSGSQMTIGNSSEIGSHGNPYVDSYLSSNEYNQKRTSRGFAILGRARGDKVYHPDGSVTTSTGSLYGYNLEKGSTITKVKRPLDDFNPQMPLHIIEEEMLAAIPELEELLAKTVEEAINRDLLSVFEDGKMPKR